jgi:hypothetical protein
LPLHSITATQTSTRRNYYHQSAHLGFPTRLAPLSFSRSIPMLSSARNHSPPFPDRENSQHNWRFSGPIRDNPSSIFPT